MSAQRKVTIRDIAESVGMSPSTVSRVLNNSRLVESGRAAEVKEAAARLGYQQRPKRRQAGRTILNIALILPADGRSYLHLFYDAGILIDTIQHGFGDTRVNVVAVPSSSWGELFEHKKIGTLDGCILAFLDPPPELLDQLDEWGIPAVVLNRIDERVNFVSCDNEGGMRALVGRVARSRGSALRLCYVDFRRVTSVSERRLAGFEAGLADAGIDRSAVLTVSINELYELDDSFFERLRSHGCNAVMCFNDYVAVYLYQAALHRGIRIPEELALTGFDNSPVRSLIEPELTTVELGVGELGKSASRWLRERIIERHESRLEQIMKPRILDGETV